MKTDAQLKRDVESELAWEPAVDAAGVGVAVKDGVVTLTGHLATFGEKHAVERAVQRVQGVRATAIEIDVKLAPGHKRGDTEIAAAVLNALAWHTEVPTERVRARVENGWITLEGEVEWDYQRNAAANAVRHLTGVVGVSNGITLKPRATPADVNQRIRDALTRCAQDEAKRIEVQITGATATLRGSVGSWGERGAAERAAWAAPGISSVINLLKVD